LLLIDSAGLKDASLDYPDSLPPPDEIAESLEAASQRFRSVAARLA